MSIGKRIKELRKEYLHLSQSDFASPLGLTHAAIGAYEKELRNVSEPSILAICREYGVNEEWLRHGTGKIFSNETNTPNIMANLAQEYNLDLSDQIVVMEYMKMDPHSRSVLKAYMQKILAAYDIVEGSKTDPSIDKPQKMGDESDSEDSESNDV